MKNNQPALLRIVIAPESSFPIIPSCHSTAAQKIRFQLVEDAKHVSSQRSFKRSGRGDGGGPSLFPMSQNINVFLSFNSIERCC